MSKKGGVFWGIFLVLAAAAIIAVQVVGLVQVGFWSLLATVLLLAIFVASLISLAFPGVTLSLAFLYMLYQQPLGLYPLNGWILVLAALVGGIGLSIVARPFRRKQHGPKVTVCMGGTAAPTPETAPPPPAEASGGEGGSELAVVESDDSDNVVYAKVSIGSVSRYLHASAFQSGQFYVSLGALEVYFDQATLHPDGADVYLECSLGSVTLYVPRHWRVENHITSAVGGVSEEGRPAPPEQRTGPALRLKGRISLGAVEIKYV